MAFLLRAVTGFISFLRHLEKSLAFSGFTDTSAHLPTKHSYFFHSRQLLKKLAGVLAVLTASNMEHMQPCKNS